MASRYALQRAGAASQFASTASRSSGTPRTSRLTIGGGGVTFSTDPRGPGITPRGNFTGVPDLRPGGQVAPSAQSLIAQGGQLLCEQFFSPSTCAAAASIIDLVGGGGGGGGGGSNLANCPTGTILNPNNGVCEAIGSPGDVSTPGGGPVYQGNLPPGATAAITVGNIQGNPIYRCPKRFVLVDPEFFGNGVCMHKAVIPNKLRKWPKAPKPPVTAYDARQMRKYGPGGSKQNSIKRLAGSAGLTCKRK